MGGVFGTVCKNDCVTDLFYGTDYHSHLGTKRGGMAVKNKIEYIRFIHNIENDYFRSKFEPDLPKLHGDKGIGVISDNDSQPLIIRSHLGSFAIVTVSKINNIDTLEKKAYNRKINFSEISAGQTSPTELIAMLISEKEAFTEGIVNAQDRIEGSCTILLLTENGLLAARDKLGRTPLSIGKKDGAYAVSSETCAFPNLGYAFDRYLGPGEIVRITTDGIEQLRPPNEKMQICSFLWVYYGYPSSSYEGINVETVRYRCGAALAENDIVDIDFAAGIPDSGIGHALGYANRRRIPYMRPFVKYTPTWPRSFMPQNQERRDLVAKMKLIPVRDLIDGKKILFCDDSIVRGTQLKDNIQLLFNAGAREIHMRIACPTLIYPCVFLNFSTSRSTLDLAGRKSISQLETAPENHLAEYATAGSPKNKMMVEHIRQNLKLTSLHYQTLDDLITCIGLPKEKLCTHCWDGSSFFN